MPKFWDKLTGRAESVEEKPRGRKRKSPRTDEDRDVKPGNDAEPPAAETPRQVKDKLDDLIERMPERRLRFAQLYMEMGSARGAALKAGYSRDAADKASYRLLRHADVREYIRLVRHEVARASRVSIEALVRQCWEIAEGIRPAGATERAAARATLARMLLALNRKTGGSPEMHADGEVAGGWRENARAAFERDVLGIDLQDRSEET